MRKDTNIPLYVHSQAVEAYKDKYTDSEVIYPILTVDDISLEVNGKATVSYKYQPELSEETNSAILALNPAHKGESITWEPRDVDEESQTRTNSSIISFDSSSLTVTGLREGNAIIQAQDGVNTAIAFVTVTEPVEPDKGNCGCYEEGDENAQIHERLYMTPEEEMNLAEMIVSRGVYTWKTSNEDIVSVSDEGLAEAKQFGETFVRAKDAEGNTVAIFDIFVCPTVTVEHANGVIYSHHVIYNSRPILNLVPGKGYALAGVTHDGEEISDTLVANSGKYVSPKPITANSVINLAELQRDPDIPTGNDSVWADSNIRIYVNGHIVNILGAPEGSNVKIFNLEGAKVIDEVISPNIEISESGIYIIVIENQSNNYKILVN